MTMGFSDYLIALLVAFLAHVALAVGFGFDEGALLKRGFDGGGPIVIGSLSDLVSSELGAEDFAEIEEAVQAEEVEAIEEMMPAEEIIEPDKVEEVPSDIIEQVSDTIQELESKPPEKKKRITRDTSSSARRIGARKAVRSSGGRGEGGQALRSNYKGRIIAHLRRHRQYPREAKRRGIKGTARMRFTLNALGRVLNSRLIASSGSAVLDKGARSTVKRANPFPPFPKGLNKSRWTFTVPIRFNVR